MITARRPSEIFVGKIVYVDVEIVHAKQITEIPAKILDIRPEKQIVEISLLNDRTCVWLPFDKIFEKVEHSGSRADDGILSLTKKE